jgi:hypothetical protein
MSIRLPRPTGIRNGGLLLVLVALAAVMALVDRPPEPGGGGRRLPGAFQNLPPPVGTVQFPPPVAEPLTAGERPAARARADTGEGATVARRHPLRVHPRPADRPGPSGRAGTGQHRSAGAGAGGGQGGGGTTTGPPVSPPPADTAPAPVARVRVPSASVRVRPPSVAGRDLPGVQVGTPRVRVDASTAEGPRLRLS